MTIDIPSLVVAAGGQVPGRVRLQKIVYLLDQIGLESGFTFEYHHYGPYSEALAEQVEDDQIFGNLKVEPRRRVTDPGSAKVGQHPVRDRTPSRSGIACRSLPG